MPSLFLRYLGKKVKKNMVTTFFGDSHKGEHLQAKSLFSFFFIGFLNPFYEIGHL